MNCRDVSSLTKLQRETFLKYFSQIIHLSGVVGFGYGDTGLIIYYDSAREGEVLLPRQLDELSVALVAHQLQDKE